MSIHQSKLDKLIDQIKEAASAEYQRGAREALAKVLSMAQPKSSVPRAAEKVGKLIVRGRAPRGAARALVERVLKRGPRTIGEIREAAKTDTEKLISYQTARLELERGKKERRYLNEGGKWCLRKDE